MENEKPIDIINGIFLALMDDRDGFISKHLDYLKKHQPLRDYEIWKARNYISEHTLEVASMYHLNPELGDLYSGASLKLFKRLSEFVKTDDAKKMLALEYLTNDSAQKNYKYFDNILQEYVVWQETGSCKELYELSEVYRGNNYGLYTADMYHNAVYFIKANGEKIDATNLEVNPWCIALDEKFDVQKKFELLKNEMSVIINKDPASTITYPPREYTADEKVVVKILELKRLEARISTAETILGNGVLNDEKKMLSEKLQELYKVSGELGISDKVKDSLDKATQKSMNK